MRALIALVAAITLGLAACGGGTSTTQSAQATQATHTVVMKNMEFTPAQMTVAPGDVVVFDNQDIVAHDVTRDDKGLSSGRLEPGKQWKWTATESMKYFCQIHPDMKGVITVTK